MIRTNQSTAEAWDILRCPVCKGGPVAHLRCGRCAREYRELDAIPVLISPDNPLFPESAYQWRPMVRRKTRLPSPSINRAQYKVLSHLARDLPKSGGCILVIGAGRQRPLIERVFASSDVRIIYCDVDASADVDVFCDAHNLPFRDEAFDLVIITAVLQHVINPSVVVQEIHRVLKHGGQVYSEIAFMQQVCEGAYDFVRYSEVGHVALFRAFACRETGIVAGPAVALIWAIENFAVSWFDHAAVRGVIKATIRIVFWPLKFLDYIRPERPGAADAASCTYYVGGKRGAPLSDSEIVAHYRGAKRLSHV